MADFDPVEYLSAKKAPSSGGFDPVSYLASKNALSDDETNFANELPVFDNAKRARLIEHKKVTAERLKKAQAPSDEDMTPGNVLKSVGGEFADRAATIGRGAADLSTHPIETFTDPSRRRQLERGVDDMVTLGYGQKVAGELERLLNGRSILQETAESDQAAHPNTRVGGNLVGMPLGLSGAIGKNAAGLARGLIPEAGKGAGLLRGVTTFGTAAPAIAAASASSEGRRGEAAIESLNPIDLTMAGVAGAGGEAFKNRVNNSKGGQARQFIESKGGTVSPTSAGKGGAFEQELKGLPANDKGIGEAARIGAEGIAEGLKEQHRVETSRPYKVMQRMIDESPESSRLRDVQPIVDVMTNAAYDLETAPHARAALESELKILERYRQGEEGPIMVPERQLNGLRRSLMRMAKVGATETPGEREMPLREAAFAAKQMVDEGPYAPLNEFYAEGIQKFQGNKKSLALKPKADLGSEASQKKIKLSLQREGQNTTTAGGDSSLDDFRAANPELAKYADMAALQKAKADLSFHLMPQHGGLMERIAGPLAPIAAIGAGLAGHGMSGAAAAGGIMALQNSAPIAGRLLYPLANRKGPGMMPLQAAAEERRRKSRKRAEMMSR